MFYARQSTFDKFVAKFFVQFMEQRRILYTVTMTTVNKKIISFTDKQLLLRAVAIGGHERSWPLTLNGWLCSQFWANLNFMLQLNKCLSNSIIKKDAALQYCCPFFGFGFLFDISNIWFCIWKCVKYNLNWVIVWLFLPKHYKNRPTIENFELRPTRFLGAGDSEPSTPPHMTSWIELVYSARTPFKAFFRQKYFNFWYKRRLPLQNPGCTCMQSVPSSVVKCFIISNEDASKNK